MDVEDGEGGLERSDFKRPEQEGRQTPWRKN